MGSKKKSSSAWSTRQARAAQQHLESNNTPREVLAAIFPDPSGMSTIQIQPVSLASFIALEKIGSPLAITGPGSRAPSAEDIAQALAVLSMPLATEEDLGRLRAFVSMRHQVENVAWQIAARIPAAKLKEIGEQIHASIQEAFSTVLPAKAPGDKSAPLAVPQPEGLPSAGH